MCYYCDKCLALVSYIIMFMIDPHLAHSYACGCGFHSYVCGCGFQCNDRYTETDDHADNSDTVLHDEQIERIGKFTGLF